MPSTYPGAPDDLSSGNTGLTHGQVSDAVAAVQATLGVNPQGGSATVAARISTIGAGLDGRTILSGAGAPASGSGLEPLDGINDPWRWSAQREGWVGPVFEVTVATGATVDVSGESPPAGAEEVDIFFTSATTLAGLGAFGTSLFDDSFGEDRYSVTLGGVGSPATTGTAPADGTGIAFLIQYETGYAGPTAVPDPSLDLATFLAADTTGVTLGSAYAFPEVQTGVDGDFYIDTTAHTLYGPKAGTWPSPVSLIGPAGADGADAADPLIVTDPDAVQWRIIVDNTGALSTELV